MILRTFIKILTASVLAAGCLPDTVKLSARKSPQIGASSRDQSPSLAPDSAPQDNPPAFCAEDGQVGCITTESFKAADMSKATPEKISLGASVAGVQGTAVHATEVCSYRGQQNCVASGPFFVGPPCSATEYGCFLTNTQGIMESFSDHQVIYVRINGNDSRGNGGEHSPFASPQKAFETAYNSDGKFVIDLGEGTFQGIDLNTASASEWPRRIAIRGAGAGISKLGGINALGKDMKQASDVPTSGKNLTIFSNNTVNLGPISANGGNACCVAGGNAGSPGTLDLTGVVTGNINISGSRGTNQSITAPSDGGTLTALYSSLGDINANGVTDTGDGLVSNGGIITLTASTSGSISANGGSRLTTGCGAHGGRVYLRDSTLKGASLAGGSGHDANGEVCDGQTGTVKGSRQ